MKQHGIMVVPALLALTLTALAAPSSSNATPGKNSTQETEPPICASLTAEYEDASKKLAMIDAEGSIDDSAMRATMREAEANKVLTQARITIDLLKNNGCKGPTYAPSAERYTLAALKCQTALSELSTQEQYDRYLGKPPQPYSHPAACDMSKWEPN